MIEQGSFRLALQIFEEGRFTPIGTIHAPCAAHYFGAEPSLTRLRLPNNQLSAEELDSVAALIHQGAARPILPGLAKAGAEEPEAGSSRKSS
jgi:hypothetical protein